MSKLEPWESCLTRHAWMEEQKVAVAAEMASLSNEDLLARYDGYAGDLENHLVGGEDRLRADACWDLVHDEILRRMGNGS